MVEINTDGKWQIVDQRAWRKLCAQSVVKSHKVSEKVTYPVSVSFPENTVAAFPAWGTVLPDSDNPVGRWSAGIVVEGDRLVMHFLVDPEIVLHTGAKLDLYQGQTVVLTATIL